MLDELEAFQIEINSSGKPQVNQSQKSEPLSRKQTEEYRGYVYPTAPEDDWASSKKGRTKGHFHPELVYGTSQTLQKLDANPERLPELMHRKTIAQQVQPVSTQPAYKPTNQQPTQPNPSAEAYRQTAAVLSRFDPREQQQRLANTQTGLFTDLRTKKNEVKIAELE